MAGCGKVLLYWGGRGLIDRLICWQTRSPYCHAALLYPDGQTVIEAVAFKGVQQRQIDPSEKLEAFDVIGMNSGEWQLAFDFAERELAAGCGYDYRSIFRFITRTKAGSKNRWFCSELVFASVRHGGVYLLERTHDWATAPGHLAWSPLLRFAWSLNPRRGNRLPGSN
jgi:uncharacterized protein YycO